MKMILIVALIIAIGLGLARKLIGIAKVTATIAIILFILDYMGVLSIG